jgi:hypothetical protein
MPSHRILSHNYKKFTPGLEFETMQVKHSYKKFKLEKYSSAFTPNFKSHFQVIDSIYVWN